MTGGKTKTSRMSGIFGRFLLLDAVLLAVSLAMLVTADYTVYLFHVVFLLLTFGAFVWSLRGFVVRALLWVTVTTVEVLDAVYAGRTQFEELAEIPLLVSILLVVFFIAKRRSEAQTKLASLFADEQERTRRLEDLSALKADFTAMVAHELDSPLAAVRAYADVLATGELGPEERDRALEKIATETDILRALVADVRFAASVEREDFSLSLCPVPVGRLLDDAAAFAETLATGHPFRVEAEEPDVEVVADPYRIGQVLRNLISNAAKYTPDETPVTLRAVRVAGEGGTGGFVVRFEVADEGPGIRPDDARRIFEKFGRGRDREGRKVPGTGLGLYLSRRIVRAHGSELAVRSRPGEGSVFSFELEVVRGDAAPQYGTLSPG